MLVIVDEMVLNILFALALLFMGVVGVLLIVLLKAPSQARTIIVAWLLKRVLTIEFTLDRSFRFIARKHGSGGVLVAKINGKKSVKVIQQNPEPSLAAACHLDGSGVKAFVCFEPLTVATSPTVVATAQVASLGEKVDELPDGVKAWAKTVNVSEQKLLAMRKKKDVKGVEVGEEKLFPLDLSLIQEIFPQAPTEAAFRNQLENEYLDGKMDRPRKDMGGGSLKFFVIAGIAIAIAVIFLLFSGVVK